MQDLRNFYTQTSLPMIINLEQNPRKAKKREFNHGRWRAEEAPVTSGPPSYTAPLVILSDNRAKYLQALFN
jgi:hypothetical protein